MSTAPSFGRVYTSTILLRRTPFTEADVQRFVDATARLPGASVRHAGSRPHDDSPVNQVISLPDRALEAWYAAYPFDVRPVVDDSPFFWHFVRFRDAVSGWAFRGTNLEEGVGERLLVLLLCVATGFAAVFLLAPLLAVRETWRAIPYKAHAGLYFAALGLGFMFLEVSLIQRLTLFLGYPTYSLTVTLFALLVSTGVGSLLSERYLVHRSGALLALGAGLIAMVLFYQVGMTAIVNRGVGWPLAARVALTILFLAPLGLCLGGFMPLGLRTVAGLTAAHGREFVAWGWAVNGFFSVVRSVLATILSMSIGFDRVMLVGAVVYAIGTAALLRVPAPAFVAEPGRARHATAASVEGQRVGDTR